MHHAFSSKIHFCNTSNVLGSFLEGPGGLWGTPFPSKFLLFHWFRVYLPLRGGSVSDLAKMFFSRNLILTEVRSISVSFDEALFGCLVTGVSSRIVLLAKVICRFVTNRYFLQFFVDMSLFS